MFWFGEYVLGLGVWEFNCNSRFFFLDNPMQEERLIYFIFLSSMRSFFSVGITMFANGLGSCDDQIGGIFHITLLNTFF